MTNPSRPIFPLSCPLCEQGLIRVAACGNCDQLVAICDECEAIWLHPRSIKNAAKPDSQHPACPHCRATVSSWKFVAKAELEARGETFDAE